MMKNLLSPSPESRLIRFRSLPQNLLVLVADTAGSFGGRFSFFGVGGWTVGGLYDTTDTLFLFFRIFRIFEFSNTSLVSRTFFAETTVVTTLQFSTGYEPCKRLLVHSPDPNPEMASFFELEDEEINIPALETDGRNWQEYHTALDQVVAKVGLSSYLVGTIPEGFEKTPWTLRRNFSSPAHFQIRYWPT